MASAIVSLQCLIAPVQMFFDWLAPRPVRAAPAAHGQRATEPLAATLRAASVVRPAARPLRVVRVFDGPRVSAQPGRLVISGRMADVCAELDRLAAAEHARH